MALSLLEEILDWPRDSGVALSSRCNSLGVSNVDLSGRGTRLGADTAGLAVQIGVLGGHLFLVCSHECLNSNADRVRIWLVAAIPSQDAYSRAGFVAWVPGVAGFCRVVGRVARWQTEFYVVVVVEFLPFLFRHVLPDLGVDVKARSAVLVGNDLVCHTPQLGWVMIAPKSDSVPLVVGCGLNVVAGCAGLAVITLSGGLAGAGSASLASLTAEEQISHE